MYDLVVAISLKSKQSCFHELLSAHKRTMCRNVTKPPHNCYTTRADPPDFHPSMAHLSEHANR